MTIVSPAVHPAVPPSCRSRRVEVARVEWRVGDPGDPADLIAAFCRDAGLPVDVSRPGVHDPHGERCGVAVLVSAAAGAVMVGGAVGAPSAVPEVPDVVLVAYAHGAPTPTPTPSPLEAGPWTPSWTPVEHAAAVAAIREAIARGDVYQANIVGHRCAPLRGASAVPDRLAGLGGDHGGSIAGDGWRVASASPELLVRVADGIAETRPIKGTAPATSEGAVGLRASVKERAEHVMIVDLERNDLAHVAVPGSVSVPELFALRRWSGLWQAESTVRARLRPGTGWAELLRAVCPPGSVTGTPKLSALDHIAALEPVGRGPAMGAFGYATAEEIRLGVTIRTVAVTSGRVHLWTGGGITWRSEPDAEVAEAEAKAAPIMRVLA